MQMSKNKFYSIQMTAVTVDFTKAQTHQPHDFFIIPNIRGHFIHIGVLSIRTSHIRHPHLFTFIWLLKIHSHVFTMYIYSTQWSIINNQTTDNGQTETMQWIKRFSVVQNLKIIV